MTEEVHTRLGDAGDGFVFCLVEGCGDKKRSLPRHLQARHNMTYQVYQETYKDPETGELPLIGHIINPYEASKRVSENSALSAEAEARGNLTEDEQKAYLQRFEILFHQADRDPALEAAVRQIALNEVYLQRYNSQMAKISAASMDAAKVNLLKQLATLAKENQTTTLALMKSLNLTREQKQAQKKTIETTPSRLVSSWERLVRLMTPEMYQRMQEEMVEASARLNKNLAGLKELAVTPVEVDVLEQ